MSDLYASSTETFSLTEVSFTMFPRQDKPPPPTIFQSNIVYKGNLPLWPPAPWRLFAKGTLIGFGVRNEKREGNESNLDIKRERSTMRENEQTCIEEK